jgi:hypothetical protein
MLRGESLRAPLLAIIQSPGKIITTQPALRSAFFYRLAQYRMRKKILNYVHHFRENKAMSMA